MMAEGCPGQSTLHPHDPGVWSVSPTHAAAFEMARALAAAQKVIRGLRVITDEHESERQQLAEQNADLLAALPDPDKLDLLADWFDQDDANKGRGFTSDPEVQRDLRAWARNIRAAIAKAKGEGIGR